MSLEPSVRDRIESLIKGDRIVLFMKGTKMMPQCGFSAKVAGILSDLDVDFTSVNVLEDPEIRQGIKVYGNWPTIPQLYVDGELQGGSDIVMEMHTKGELHDLLGVEKVEAVVPTLSISEAALKVLRQAADDAEEPFLRLSIDPQFRHQLYFDHGQETDAKLELDGLTVVLDGPTSRRAEGLCIDFVDGPEGTGFKIDNPNAPPKVQGISVQALKAKLDAGESVDIFDVRGTDERSIAHIEGTVALDVEGRAHLETLDKNQPIYFICHHGGRSQQAAQHYLGHGYRNVFSVEGGIDAWSLHIDTSLTRY